MKSFLKGQIDLIILIQKILVVDYGKKGGTMKEEKVILLFHYIFSFGTRV